MRADGADGILPALPKTGVAPSFRPVRSPFFGPAKDAVVAQLVRAPVCGTGGRWFEPTQLYQRIQWRHFRRNIDLMFSFGWPCFGWQQTHALRCAVPSLAQHRSDTFADWCTPTMGGAENAHHSYKLGSGGGLKPSFLKSGPPARLKRARMIVNAVVMWRSAFACRLNGAARPAS